MVRRFFMEKENLAETRERKDRKRIDLNKPTKDQVKISIRDIAWSPDYYYQIPC